MMDRFSNYGLGVKRLLNADHRPQINVDALRAEHRLSSVIGRSLKLRRAGREWVAQCPFHPDRSPSFTVNDDKGFYHCFGCGAHGDVLDWLQHSLGVGFREAAEMLGGQNYPVVPISTTEPAERGSDRLDEALAIWEASVPAGGTAAESYLRSRGLHLPIPDALRFTRLRYGKRGQTHPVMVALATGADGRPIGIQRTYLNASGTGKAAVPKAKLSLGSIRGGAVRLAPAARELVLCEGIEDGLTLQQETGRAVWAAAGAGMLPAIQLPNVVTSVVIGADNDAAGREAAHKAAHTFALQGRATRVIYPAEGFKDFNQELKEAR